MSSDQKVDHYSFWCYMHPSNQALCDKQWLIHNLTCMNGKLSLGCSGAVFGVWEEALSSREFLFHHSSVNCRLVFQAGAKDRVGIIMWMRSGKNNFDIWAPVIVEVDTQTPPIVLFPRCSLFQMFFFYHVYKDVRVWPSEEQAGVSTGTQVHGSDIPAGAFSGDQHVSNPPISSQSHPFHASSSNRSDLV